MIAAALLLAAASPVAAKVDAVATRAGLAGEVLVAKRGKVLLDKGYGPVAPGGGPKHQAGARWRLASITKQVTAALVVGALAADPELGSPQRAIDDVAAPAAPIGKAAALAAALDDIYLYPALLNPNLGALSLRQVLTHHSGLANPDDTPLGPDGVPAAYKMVGGPDPSYCLSRPAVPGSAFSYNNCDYILLGEVLRHAGEPPGDIAWPKGMAMAARGEKGVPGFVGGKPEPAFELASWGAAGGLMGTARSVFAFDRSLMTGKLLARFARDELWKPEGNGSYQALGQWVFPGRLKGCAAPKRIVQRDGEIYGVQARNFIFPDDDLVVIVFTNRSSDDFKLGEVWEGKGFVYDLLSAAVCP